MSRNPKPPLTLEQEWEGFVSHVFRGLDRDSRQFSYLRSTFFAGALALYDNIVAKTEGMTEEEGTQLIASYGDELVAFSRDVEENARRLRERRN